jgi:hypothetical protein
MATAADGYDEGVGEGVGDKRRKRKAPTPASAEDNDDVVAYGDGDGDDNEDNEDSSGQSGARLRSSDDSARRAAIRLLKSARKWPLPQVVAKTFDELCAARDLSFEAEKAVWARVLNRPIPATWSIGAHYSDGPDEWGGYRPAVRAGTQVKGARGGPPPNSGTHAVLIGLHGVDLEIGSFRDGKLYNGVSYSYMDEPTSESDANHVDGTGEHRFFALQHIWLHVGGRIFGSVERRTHWPLEPPYEDGPIEWHIGARAGYQDREGTSAGRADKWHLESG